MSTTNFIAADLGASNGRLRPLDRLDAATHAALDAAAVTVEVV